MVNLGNDYRLTEDGRIMKGRSGRRKYGNQPITVDGHRFDSKAEAAYYAELKIRLDAGEIDKLELQPEFELLPSFTRNGKKERAITYRADFSWIEDGNRVVVDVKGAETKVFKMKRKMLLYFYPQIDFRIVKV